MTDKHPLIYDIEIRKAVPSGAIKAGELDPGIEYCQGWHDHRNMGVACVGAYDFGSQRYRVFAEDNRAGFIELANQASVLVGFNNIRFDDAVLNASGWRMPESVPRYDILNELWKAKGLDPANFSDAHKGHGLEACSMANGGTGKTGHGAEAPKDFQRGRWGSLIDYCLEDVRLTKRLFDRARIDQGILDPTDPSKFVDLTPPD